MLEEVGHRESYNSVQRARLDGVCIWTSATSSVRVLTMTFKIRGIEWLGSCDTQTAREILSRNILLKYIYI
jgi:hypothetical protein